MRKHRIAAAGAFTRQALPVAKLYGLHWSETEHERPSIKPTGNFDAIKLVRTNVYRNYLIHTMGRETAFARFAAAPVRSAASFEFHRDRNFATADAHLNPIERHIRDA